MFTKATVAAAAPFLLGLTHASPVAEVVRSHSVPLLLTPNFPVAVALFDRDPDPFPAPNQVLVVDKEVSTNVSLVPTVPLDQSINALTVLGSGFDYDFACNAQNDQDCYKRWWDFYHYCHPYDRKCYRDFRHYDDYYGSCKNYDKYNGKCYDRCYYDQDGCDKYGDCGDEYECYQKKRKDDYCHPRYDDRYDPDCLDRHEPPWDYCKPYDYDCHRKPGYPEEPDYPDDPDYGEPDDPDYGEPDDPDYGEPEYPPQKPGYPPNKPEYPPHKPEYPPGKPDYGKPGYPEKPEYPDKPGHGKPGYPPNKPEYPPQKPGYPPNKPEYPPHKPEYPPHKPEYPSHEPEYPPHKPKYPPHRPDYPDEPDFPDEPGYPDGPDDEYDFICYPGWDKDCYPDIPDFPHYDNDDGEKHPHKAKQDVVVKFYSKKHGLLFKEKVWPDGQEFYIEHQTKVVDYIKYWAKEDEEYNVRCLASKNWFPWGPLPLYSYKEAGEDGYVVRTLELKRPQPVEVVRCDFI